MLFTVIFILYYEIYFFEIFMFLTSYQQMIPVPVASCGQGRVQACVSDQMQNFNNLHIKWEKNSFPAPEEYSK